MKAIFNKESTELERLNKLETVVTRLARRATEKKKVLLTPFPIANAVFGNVRGRILSYMFNTSGTITKGCIWMDKKLKEGARIRIELLNDEGGGTKEYILNRREIIVSPNEPVRPFDRLSIFLIPNDPEEVIKECWISFLWVPTVKDVNAKSYLMKEIEKDVLQEFNEEVS